ncbi:hypothetical protein DFJ73DRAFT_824001, partial [Zopfochytrium polystomum]
IWNASTGQELHRMKTDSKDVRSVAFSPGGKLVGLVTLDGTVTIWNSSTGQKLIKLEKHFTELRRAVFSDDRTLDFSNYFSDHSAVWQLSPEPDHGSLAALHSFGLVRSASGEKLYSADEAPSAAINGGVWFSEKEYGVCCWVPPELRGQWQILSDKSIFLLGAGFSGLIQF